MASRQDDLASAPNDDTGSRISSVPLLGEGFSENASTMVTSSDSVDGEQETTESPEVDSKTGKRRFWNLGKKKEDEKTKKKKEAALATASATVSFPAPTIRPVSPLYSPRMAHASYPHHPTSHPYAAPASPGRNAHTSSYVSSPASSQIFERNVQEDGLCASASPSIPAHITTENHIPPVLDASSVAITDDHLDPDNVEIVMHSAHQPAALTVTGSGSGTSEVTGTTWQDDLVAHPDNDDAASNYGALDSTDVHRLSFISFADVVHAEHAEHNADHTNNNRDSLHLSGVTGHPALGCANRSPSPIRSATSSHGRGPSPPLSGSASFQGMETSSNYGGRGPGSPFSAHSPPTGGELTIETMRQALRKTGSGDLAGARSQPMSAVGGAESILEHHPFK